MARAGHGGDEAVSVAEILMDLLARAGVRDVFGVAGSTIMPILDAIAADPRIRYVAARHEQSAADMASGYARASARLGVVTTHVGPGATNCLTTMVGASREGVPLLLVTGNEETSTLAREPYHDWDVLRIMGTITRFSYRITRPDELPHVVRRAVGQAARAVTQPVHIDLPEDVAAMKVPRADAERWLGDVAPMLAGLHEAGRVPLSRPAPARADVDRVARLVAGASAPVLVLGEAIQWSSDPATVVRRCETLGLPYVTTHGGRGGVRESERYLGTMGRFGSRDATTLVGEADLVLALGAELSDIDTVQWRVPNPASALVAVHPDARTVDLRVSPTVGIVADVGEFVEMLERALVERGFVPPRDWLRRTGALDGRHGPSGGAVADDADLALDALLVQRVIEAAPESWAVAVDPGLGPLSLTADARLGGRRFLYPYGFGYMGSAVPQAIGAVVSGAVDGAVAVIGDGSFFMSMASVESVGSSHVPVVVVVLDDGGFGSQRQKQRDTYGRNFGVDYENPDIARIGAALGLEACWVRSADDVDELCAGLAHRERGALAVVRRTRPQNSYSTVDN